jgi:integrase
VRMLNCLSLPIDGASGVSGMQAMVFSEAWNTWVVPEQFCLLPPLIAEPYRTQVWVAGCLGLRPSEIMPLQWGVKTEYSRDRVPLDAALIGILLEHRERWFSTPEGWVFANPATGRPYHQDTIQQNHIREPGKKAELGDGIGWKTFRRSYRSWMDDTLLWEFKRS